MAKRPRRSPGKKRKKFSAADYLNKFTNEELSCMAAGTICLWMALDPTIWGKPPFKTDKEYLAAVTRGARELRRIYPGKPLSDRARRPAGGYVWSAVVRRLRRTTSLKRIS